MKRKDRYMDYADAPSEDMEIEAGRSKEERQKKAIGVINKILIWS